MVHVPYKGAGPAITDLIGGRLDFMITTLPSVVGFIETGKAKPLAVTTPERTKRLPEVPTIAESGLPDYQSAAWYGFAVPKGTPPEIVPSCARRPSPRRASRRPSTRSPNTPNAASTNRAGG